MKKHRCRKVVNYYCNYYYEINICDYFEASYYNKTECVHKSGENCFNSKLQKLVSKENKNND